MTLVLPNLNQSGTNEWQDVEGNDRAIRDYINAGLVNGDIAAGASITWAKMVGTNVQAQLGVNDGTTVSRGKSIISATESRTNTAYGALTTPDKVSGIVLPTDGLVVVAYQTTWQESVAGAARAAIFIGSNQLKLAEGTAGIPDVQAGMTGDINSPNTDYSLASFGGGLVGGEHTAYSGDVTTGQAIGLAQRTSGTVAFEVGAQACTASGHANGPCHIFAAAGTYDISVQFKASSGSVTAKNRKLWVWTIGF